MTGVLAGVVLLGADSDRPVDIRFDGERIGAITLCDVTPDRRLLALPALVNAHDHARPLSPTI